MVVENTHDDLPSEFSNVHPSTIDRGRPLLEHLFDAYRDGKCLRYTRFIGLEPGLSKNEIPESLWDRDLLLELHDYGLIYKEGDTVVILDSGRRLVRWCRSLDPKVTESNPGPINTLDPTDESILRIIAAFTSDTKKRMLTGEISKELGRPAKNIAKNLSKLVKSKYLNNQPRKGYQITRTGRNAVNTP